MEVRNLLKDDDAVSPVIGVILMVAITVILAAVIATFVLGLGEQVSETAPQASFTFDYNEGSTATDSFSNSGGDGILNITHAGGDTLVADRLSVSGATGSGGNWVDDTSVDPQYSSGDKVSAGDEITVIISSDDTVSITWMSEAGQSSSTLRRWSGPDA